MIEECPHGMDDPDWCSICKHGVTRPVTKPRYGPAIITARFDGQCVECNLPVMPGHLVTAREDNERVAWVHVGCVPHSPASTT